MNYLNTATAFTLFGKARKNEIYVDKSLLIEKISGKIDTNSQYICITRPRRFGKSMNVHMMGAYYTDENSEKVAAMLEEVHDLEIPFLQYNDENSLSCVVTLCYLSARDSYFVEREAKSGKGYCDYMFLPKKKGLPALILELKADDSCEAAISQIKEKGYHQKAKKWADEVLLVGICYDKERRIHRCIIEKSAAT